jgi:hypothetical protein
MGRRYHVLLTKLDVQRLCLTLWGESFGLLPEAGRSKDTRLDKANIQDTIEKVLLCIQALFQDAEDLTERYGLRQLTKSRNRNSKSTNPVFADTFARFEDEIQETQQQASVWKATRWAIHDVQKFSLLINNDVKELVTSL